MPSPWGDAVSDPCEPLAVGKAVNAALPSDGFSWLKILSKGFFLLPVCWEQTGFHNTHVQPGISQPCTVNITQDRQFLLYLLGCFAPAVSLLG